MAMSNNSYSKSSAESIMYKSDQDVNYPAKSGIPEGTIYLSNGKFLRVQISIPNPNSNIIILSVDALRQLGELVDTMLHDIENLGG